MVEVIYDKSKASSQSTVKLEDGKFVRAENVVAVAGEGGGGGATINNQDIDVTENGVYTADTGYTGLGTVNVNVPTGTTINNQNITVTENGTYTADVGYTGLGTVEVQVPNPSTGILSIVKNGSYDVTQYATAEVNVPTGGGGAATKFGVSIDNIFPVAGSELSRPITPTTDQQFSLNMDGITKIGSKALVYKFYYNNAITGAEFPDLVEIYSDEACCNAFVSCQNLKVISVPKLESINGAKACDSMFMLAGIEGQVSLPSLKTIQGSNACEGMFSYNSGITGVSVPSLTTIDGYGACRNMFQNTGLTRVDFSALTTITNANSLGTNSSNGMFAGCTGLLEIHFRADAQATIEGLSGYASKFGAPSTCTIYFDL